MKCGGELGVEVAVGSDGELVVAVHASCRGQVAEDSVGVGVEVLVDLQRLTAPPVRGRTGWGEVDGYDVFPRGAGRRTSRQPTAQDQQVDDDIGARASGEGALGEPDGTDEVGEHRHLPASGRVAGVEGVAGGEGDDEPAGSGEVERLEEEVVVQGVAAPVVVGVVRGDLGERDVADRHVEGAVLDAEVFERSGVDGGAGAVEMAGDHRGGGVQLDPGEHSVERSEPQEVPRPTARFEHPDRPVDTQVTNGGPHGGDDRRRGVVSVEGGATGLAPRLLGAEKLTDLRSLGREAVVGVVEHLGDRPPPGPPGERSLFGRVRRTVLVAAAAHDLERIEVGAQLGRRTRWGEVVLARRSERFALG